MPAYATGLSGQVGFVAETTVGTAVTVTKFVEFLNESLKREAGWQRSAGLRAGQGYVRTGRLQQTSFTVNGGLSLEVPDRGVGLLWKHSLGSTITVPTQIAATTAYEQIHIPGSKAGMGLTMQVGRPEAAYPVVVRPFTYRGVKITEWEFSIEDGGFAQWSLTLDGWEEDVATALAVASFPTGGDLFNWRHATTFKIGGTASTTGGKITIAGGTPATTVFKTFTIRGATPMDVERRGLGGGGVKKEQFENDNPGLTGTLGGEFTSRTEIYDLVRSGASTALEINFDTGVAAGVGNNFQLGFKIPAVKFSGNDGPNVNGPGIIPQSVDFECTDDGTNAPLEVRVVSTDTTL